MQNQTREIPREAWVDYLTLLSSIERDHRVRIEAEGPDVREQTMTDSLPLVDISVEEKGSAQGAIEVTVGRPGEEITHRILHPEHVRAEESESGEIECIGIEDADHLKTLIYFEPLGLPEEAVSPQDQAWE
jgi:hypothetical protein